MTVEINGSVAGGFEKVADAFAENFAQRGEVGAACAVFVGGEQVVDLWAGVADPATGRPYEADTLQLVFSSTKGVVSTAVHQLAQQGKLKEALRDYDAALAIDGRMASAWFARAGVEARLGHPDKARANYQRCLETCTEADAALKAQALRALKKP